MDTIVGTYCSFYMTVCCPGWVGNILKINCASSWFFFKLIYQDARSKKHKIYSCTYNVSGRNNGLWILTKQS